VLRRPSTRPWWRRPSVLAAATAAAAVWALWIEPRRLVVRRVDLDLPGWPEGLDGLRVAVLSDLHTGGPHVDLDRVERAVWAINARAPDLVCLLGDYLDDRAPFARAPAPRAIAAALAALRAPLGTVAVLGNHDWLNAGPRMAGALAAAGITVLENDAWRADAPGGPLWIAGLGDYRSREPSFAVALRDVPEGDPVLALSHDPDVFPRAPARVALTLSGHLHGGQVRPAAGTRHIPSRYGRRYLAGHVVEGGRHLYVTSGMGTSGLPVRLLRPPEVALLTLRRSSPGKGTVRPRAKW
jgi:uncharacterized protein